MRNELPTERERRLRREHLIRYKWIAGAEEPTPGEREPNYELWIALGIVAMFSAPLITAALYMPEGQRLIEWICRKFLT